MEGRLGRFIEGFKKLTSLPRGYIAESMDGVPAAYADEDKPQIALELGKRMAESYRLNSTASISQVRNSHLPHNPQTPNT